MTIASFALIVYIILGHLSTPSLAVAIAFHSLKILDYEGIVGRSVVQCKEGRYPFFGVVLCKVPNLGSTDVSRGLSAQRFVRHVTLYRMRLDFRRGEQFNV